MQSRRVFLDANILFSAAYNDNSKLQKIWQIKTVILVTSDYVMAEARRNIDHKKPQSLPCLKQLLAGLQAVPTPAAYNLPMVMNDKDAPVVAAAYAAHCHLFVSGDHSAFAPFYGHTIAGMTFLRPAEFLGQYF